MAGSEVDVSVTIQGTTELTHALRLAGADVLDMRETFQELAREAAHLAASLAPQRTGALAASIRPAATHQGNLGRVTIGSPRVPYARVINYGWPEHGIKAANFIAKTDAVMRPRAQVRLEAAVERSLSHRGLT
jgi:hypothetical protein